MQEEVTQRTVALCVEATKLSACLLYTSYLFDQLVAYSQTPESRASAFRTGESWVLGDNPAPGLLLYEHRFQFDWVPAPYVTADQTYAAIGRNRPIRVYKGCLLYTSRCV